MSSYALGLIETKGLIAAIEACDAAAKAAAVVISAAELTDAALVTIKIEGELGAVQAAVEAGARAAAKVGEVIAAHVIPRPDDELAAITPPIRYVSNYHKQEKRPRFTYDNLDSGNRAYNDPQTKPAPKKPSVSANRDTSRVSKEKVHAAGDSRGAVAVSAEKSFVTQKNIGETVTLAHLESLPVSQLRQFARSLSDLPIQGRQISMANKQELIEAIKQIRELK
ncbi:MAG: BMC domain-containing protein [candidate division Zixibacteria bacterium]|nr:BMC domain-containing protein [candidate division Zixibacteria bacterium]